MATTTKPAGYQFLPPLTPDEYEGLVSDIAIHGVQVPVELDEEGDVLDGHHRLRACAELGIRDYPSIIRYGLSEEEKVEHIVALNSARRHLTRQQRRELAVELGARGWSTRRIASALGVTQPTVRADLEHPGERNLSPDKVTGADGKSYPARRPAVIATSQAERRGALDALKDLPAEQVPGRMTTAKRIEKLARRERAAQRAFTRLGDVSLGESTLWLGDFRERGREIADESVSLIITDPPYDRESLPLYSGVAELAARVLKPNGVLVCYAGQLFLPEIIEMLGAHLDYWWTIALVLDGDHTQVHQRKVQVCWKALLIYVPRGGEAPEWISDLYRSETFWRPDHPWQQSRGVADYLVGRFTQPGDLIVDPMVCTGTVGVATMLAGSRRFLGIDINEKNLSIARENIAAAVDGGEAADSAGPAAARDSHRSRKAL